MIIEIDDVLNDIYALTAMSTINDKAVCPLLHPGHSDALRLTVGDSLGIILAMVPKGSVTLTRRTATHFEFALADGLDPLGCCEAMRSALCHVTIWMIRRAGGLTKLALPDFFITAFTRPESAVADPEETADEPPTYHPATIRPYY